MHYKEVFGSKYQLGQGSKIAFDLLFPLKYVPGRMIL